MERRKVSDRRVPKGTPDTERKMVLPDRRRDGIARRIADAIAHAALMSMRYPNPERRMRK